MKTNELKKVLKPLIKQCIKEVIFEEGVLSGIISEVVKGVNTAPVIKEQKNFEGTDAMASESNSHSPLANIAPSDSGVDIAGIFNSNWSKLVQEETWESTWK